MKKENLNEKKQNNKSLYYIIIICFLLLIIIIGIIFCTNNNNNLISNLINQEETETIELKHTDSLTTKSDGIYITDVSEVVNEVMPSIVAITSKTVMNSGKFGPSYSRSYTSEGAGSGVIVAENDSELFILTNNHVVE